MRYGGIRCMPQACLCWASAACKARTGVKRSTYSDALARSIRLWRAFMSTWHSFTPAALRNELELYQHALKLNPLELEAVLGAVEYFLRENRRKEALSLLEKYRGLNPNHVPTLMALGRIYIENGDMPKLLPLFETIVRLDPQNVEAFYNLGITYYHRNDLENAMRFFQRAQQIANYPDAHLYLAQIYERRGDTTAALDHLRERIRLSSGNDDVYAAEARQHLYKLLLKRGEIPGHLLPGKLEDSNQRKH